jgi:hypothetical protein
LQHAGEQFVIAFTRPLIDPSSPEPPIKLRLRFVRRGGKLEISIAPNAGRRYPNLTDHKKNVEYDVSRVLRLLQSQVVLDGLRAEGPWVIVTIRLIDLQEAGAK